MEPLPSSGGRANWWRHGTQRRRDLEYLRARVVADGRAVRRRRPGGAAVAVAVAVVAVCEPDHLSINTMPAWSVVV